jgi:hypothetical protein
MADPRVCMYHMACRVDGNRVTMLYRLTNGPCPKVPQLVSHFVSKSAQSYGLQAAEAAGLPREVVARADEKARKFEEETPLLSGNYLCACCCLHVYLTFVQTGLVGQARGTGALCDGSAAPTTPTGHHTEETRAAASVICHPIQAFGLGNGALLW